MVDIIGSDVSETVVALYSEILQVEAIYKRQSDDLTSFWIFTSNTEYDNNLVDKLADQESELLDRFQNTDILVRHVPTVLYPDHRDVTGSVATLLFKR